MDIRKIARECIIDIKAYVPGKPVEEVQRELGLTDVLKMASNENPIGTSPLAIKAMLREITESVQFYPESHCPALCGRLAQIHHLDAGQFFVSNGVDGVLSMLGNAFIDCGDETVASQFSFYAYQNVTRRMGGKPVLIAQTPDWRIDVDGLIAAITPRTKIIFLCNPNNPTGTITRLDEFERLLAATPENTLLVSDEAYYDFVDDPDYPQTVPYLKNHPNLVITRTFSKIMGLAGVRIGYAMADPEVIQMLRKVADPFPVNRVAQAGALASLDDEEFRRCSIQIVCEGREQLVHGLAKMGLKPLPSQGNFVFVDLGIPSTPVFEDMLRQGVIARPLGPQGLPNALRITVGTRQQNVRALQVLSNVLS